MIFNYERIVGYIAHTIAVNLPENGKKEKMKENKHTHSPLTLRLLDFYFTVE